MKIEYLADRPEYVSTLAAWHRREWGYLRPDESVEDRAAMLQAWSGRRQIPTVFVASAVETLLGSAMLVAHDTETRLQWSPWLAGSVAKPAHAMAKAVLHYAAIARQHKLPVIMANCVGASDNFVGIGQFAVWNDCGELLAQMDSESEGIIMDTASGTARISMMPET